VIIHVNGLPAPMGSKRHVGRGVMVESSKRVGPWRDAVRTETQSAMNGGSPFLTAVRVRLIFHLPRPMSHTTPKGVLRAAAPDYPVSRRHGDLDKLARSTADGLVDGGALVDDSQIVELHAFKRYAPLGEPPGAVIHIHDYPERP
jgi:crossover junction endodeoxyribonuclease RusA